MIDLLIAAALLQTEPPACNAVPPPADRPADCTSWRLLRETPTGNSYVAPQALRRDGDIVEILNRVVFLQTTPSNIRSAHLRIRLDCRQRTVLVGHLTGYDAAGIQRLDTDPPASVRPERTETGSAYGDMIAIFCPGQEGGRR